MADTTFGQLRQDVMLVLEGDFVAKVVEAKATKNSKGNHMIKAKFQVAAGPYTGRTIMNNFNITTDSPNAMKMFFTHMQHLGFDDAYFSKLPNDDAGVAKLAADMVGRVVTLTLGKGSYLGVDREEIQGLKPAPDGMSNGPATSTLPVAQALPTAQAQALPTTQPVAATTTEVTGSVDVELPMTVGGPAVEEPKLPF